MKPESFYSPFFEPFSFCGRVCMRGKANRDQSFFLEQGSEISKNIFLFASQFYGNSFVDFGTCCYTYNPSIVAVAKSSIATVLFSPISKRFICLFFLASS